MERKGETFGYREPVEHTELFALELRLAAATRLIIAALGLALLVTGGLLRAPALALLLVYVVLGTMFSVLPAANWLIPQVGRALILAGTVLDTAYISWLVYQDGGATSRLFLLYLLPLWKGALLYPYMPQALMLAVLFAPLYVAAAFAAAGSFYFVRQADFLATYALLFAMAGLSAYAGHTFSVRQQRIRRLYHLLSTKNLDLERKTSVLQRTATELSNRVVELRSLQEGIKAISSALALEDVLRLIVENASQVLAGSPCYLAAVEQEGQKPALLTWTATSEEAPAPALLALLEQVAQSIVQAGQPVSHPHVVRDMQFGEQAGLADQALIGAPLMVEGRPLGALMALSPRPFTDEQLDLLAAFADQAAVALKNARLYRDLAQEKRRSEEKSSELEAIVRGIGDGVIVTDAQLRLVLINPSAMRIFGLTSPPIMGQPLRAYVRNEALLELLEETRKAPAQMAVREIPLPPTRDRQPVYQGLASVLRSADGDISGIVTVLRDITGQKELERMKSNFLSVISHELKTPLHSIKGFVDIILMGKTGPINEVQRDFLSTVKDQTAQLQRLINDLLEFSRLESGQIKLQPEMMAVSSLVDEVMEKLRPLAEQGGLTLVNELPADFPAIEADPVRMEQVFSNLIDNAIKFTPAGGTITVAGEVIADGVRLYFKDTGIGIPLEERERIFDRFYQIEGGPTRPYRGTGLGLTICKHIVERHHGHIWVEGEPGQGAIFVVELPLRLPREEELSLDFSALPSSSAPERRDDAGAGR